MGLREGPGAAPGFIQPQTEANCPGSCRILQEVTVEYFGSTPVGRNTLFKMVSGKINICVCYLDVWR